MARRERFKKPEKRSFVGIVGHEKVSVDDMVEKVQTRIKKEKRVRFRTLFRNSDSRPEMIATFLAILEMIRFNRLEVSYNSEQNDYVLEARPAKTENKK